MRGVSSAIVVQGAYVEKPPPFWNTFWMGGVPFTWNQPASIMNTHPFPFRGAIASVLLLATLHAQAARPSGPSEEGSVVLTGWLHVEDYSFSGAVLHVNVNGISMEVPVSETGRFQVAVPADSEALLRFEKPGHLAKEVLVDSRNAGIQEQRRRKVRFAVVLELERQMAGFTYAGPVGSIGFDAQGGCLAVDHHKELKAPGKNKPMVF